MTPLQTYINTAYQNAIRHGFHDEKKSNEHWLMLVISEVCEVMEAHRKGEIADQRESFITRQHVHPDFNERYEAYIKGSMAEELADMCIRIFDFMGVNDITEDDLYNCTMTGDKLAKCIDKYSLPEQAFEVITAITQGPSETVICRIVLEYAKYWANKFNIDLNWHIQTKMQYNKNRPMMHNKAY